MKIIQVEQNSAEWLEARKGKITGSKLKDIVVKRGTGKKLGFYELIADRLAIEADGEDVMERGHRLEQEAVDMFSELTGVEVTTGIGLCISDENPNIALSPDGLIKEGKKFTGAVEVKCLSASRHLQAYFEQKVPDEYEFQVLQYFIVNTDLKKLYFVFYDPRVTVKPLHYIEIERSEVEDDVKMYLDYQTQTLLEVDELLTKIAF
jgi:putative phage-type endonuclease